MEFLVYEADRLLAVLVHDDEGDVQLARSLRDSDHVHRRFPERSEYARRDAGGTAHPLPHRGYDRDRAFDLDPLDVVAAQLGVEHPLERLAKPGGRFVRNDEADRVLARGLADHHHRYAFSLRGIEDAGRETGNPAHTGALDSDQPKPAERGRGFHDAPILVRLLRDR